MSVLGFDHVALAVTDLPRTAKFYVDLLGLRVVDARNPAHSDFLWLSCGPAQSINLMRDPGGTPRALGRPLDLSLTPHVAFSATPGEVERLEKALREAGTEVHASASGVYFCDPAGHLIEVTCWRERTLRQTGAQHW